MSASPSISLGHRFTVQATGRAVALLGAMILLAYLLFETSFIITPTVVALLCIALLVEFVFFVQRTNREVSRFFDSIRHADFSHRVDPKLKGAGFEELARSMREITERLQILRNAGESEKLQSRSIVEHVPVPMFSVIASERVVLHNHAARRLFGTRPAASVEDLARISPGLVKAIREQIPGQSTLINIPSEDSDVHKMTLSLTEIVVGNEHQRLITLQNIGDALAASELEAWQQMAQVLAHEIMNSLTPVASLANTARTLLDDESGNSQTQAREAISTVAQRADSLMGFVQGYRRFTRLPAPKMDTLSVSELLSDMELLVSAEVLAAGISLTAQTPANDLQLRGDRQQLEQVLINLVRNAMDALASIDQPEIRLIGRRNRRGRVVIEVQDNGDGIPESMRDRVFVPYFSTRTGGSGVGLALTRQVMIAHGGSVTITDAEPQGTRIGMVF
ncbi:MAG: ATP-binding protein [Pseudomonadota bacterium]